MIAAAERALLGALLLDPERIDDIAASVAPEDMLGDDARHVLAALLALHARREPIDVVSVSAQLRTQQTPVDSAKLATLIAPNVLPSHAGNYARHVRQASRLREMWRAMDELRAQSFAGEVAVDDAIERAESVLTTLAREDAASGYRSIAAAIIPSAEDLERRYELKGAISGIASGFWRLDQMLCGYEPGQLIVIAARPGVGKTALALNMALNIANAGVTVGIQSCEMSEQQIMHRLVAQTAMIPLHAIRAGRLNGEDWTRVVDAYERLRPLPLHIDESSAVTVQQVRSRAKRLHRKHNLGVLIVDYLALMRPDKRGENRTREVTEITAALKALAKELGIPVIALSQLNREMAKRASGLPMLSDLRESGSIEQDADVVIFIHRPEVGEHDEDKRLAVQGQALLIVAKQRNGETGNIKAHYDGRFTLFSEVGGLGY